MKTPRRIKTIFKSEPTIEGAGVHLKRAFGYGHIPRFDPFLMLDDFHTSNPSEYLAGFPWHPHRGIETVTYVLEGIVEHGDSMGNQGVIGVGDVQWMTAGSGIIHQEMPKQSPTGAMWGFQLWVNLPASRKMMPPRYRDVKAADIPEVRLDPGVRVKIVSGELDGIRGPVRDIVMEPEFFDVSLPPDSSFVHEVKPGYTAFAYVMDGEGYFDEQRKNLSYEVAGPGWSYIPGNCRWGAETVILYEREGEQVIVTATDKPVRFLFLTGKPLGEPIAWRGPIVMNTQEELRVAFEEFQNGTFIK